MIDVHTHILPFIDDGSKSMEESLKMLDQEITNGIKDIILTPHALRYNLKKYTKQDLINIFNDFKEVIKDKYDVNLYLGQEISYHKNLIFELKNDNLFTLNQTKYILLELPFSEEIYDFEELIYNCELLGLKIVIAHIERYNYLNFLKIMQLKNFGVLLQVNSNSIVGNNDKNIQKLVFKLFKYNLIDFVGSDIHSFRKNSMKEAYQIVNKKFGEEISNKVFIENPKQLFNIK